MRHCLSLSRKLPCAGRVSIPRHFGHKLCHLLQGCLRLIAMWRVLAIRQHQDLGRGHGALNRLYLCYGSILILFTLNAENRAAYRRQIFLNIPLPKLRIEPNVSEPSPRTPKLAASPDPVPPEDPPVE